MTNLTGLRLVHGLHYRVWNLLRNCFPDRLGNGVIYGTNPRFPHWFANLVLNLFDRLFSLVSNAVDCLLLNYI